MRDYIVEYNIKGIEVLLIKNCRSKKEAIKKAKSGRSEDGVEGLDFNITQEYWSTATARIDGE